MTEAVRGAGERPKFGVLSQMIYGSGAAAFGIKDNGFRVFLVFFYNQVVGLPALWVTVALAVALAIDSIVDPIIGQMSDHWRSRWGRRHPFMYGAVIPAAISYILLWSPPMHAAEPVKLLYMVVLAIVSRSFITMYEIPSSAMTAELTTDYDQRTRVIGWRVLFAWWGGLTLNIYALLVYMKKTPEYPNGQLNPDAYAPYAWTAAALMVLFMLASSIGTHRRIPWLPQAPEHRPQGVLALFRDMFQTLGNKHFFAITGVAIFAAAAEGVGFSIYIYIVTYFWHLPSETIGKLITDAYFGSLFALFLAPALTRGRNKKNMAFWLLIANVVLSAAPLLLRMADLFPTGGRELFWSLYAIAIVRGSCGITCTILVVGMIADVVEDSQVTTGKRSEGLFFAAIAFVQKSVSGLGAITTGVIVAFVGIAPRADPATVPQSTAYSLALCYLVAMITYYGGALVCLTRYRITRQTHEENLAKIAAMEKAVERSEPPVG